MVRVQDSARDVGSEVLELSAMLEKSERIVLGIGKPWLLGLNVSLPFARRGRLLKAVLPERPDISYLVYQDAPWDHIIIPH